MRLTPQQFAAHLRQMPQSIRESARQAEDLNVADTLEQAIWLSSGPHSLAELRAAGHPYSRRDPQYSLFPPFILNEQEGEFKGKWGSEHAHEDGWRLVSRVFNTDEKAGFFAGTPLMVPRPIQDAAVGIIAPIRRRRLEQAAVTGVLNAV